ncbi:LEA domain protein [Aspergillus lucknowensis]|uniref:DUF6987 domain-containing protein n=1 Tax=Aspergillus lucknowensis TaxID=176173 RepID=A0ABR4M2I9_9EURO
MWSPFAKSDQRSNDSGRRQSGSSATPNQENQTRVNVKEAGTRHLQEQEAPALEREGEDKPSTPAPKSKVPQTEQRDDNESQASGPAESSGGGVFGKLKSLGGGLTQPVMSTVKNVRGKASKSLEVLKDLLVREDGQIAGPDGNIMGQVVEGGQEAVGGTVQEGRNIVDETGKTVGRAELTDEGQLWDSRGNVIGKAKTIAFEGCGEEPPFAGLENIHVVGSGFVEDAGGRRVGKLTDGDAKKLIGRPESVTVGKNNVLEDGSGRVVGRVIKGDAVRLTDRKVDGDGDILDKNGNTVGQAEPWEPEEKKGDVNSMAGRKIIREGEVRDVDGNLIGRLTSGNLSTLIGKEIDDNGCVVDNDGNKIVRGPLPRKQEAQENRDLAKMTSIAPRTLDRVNLICMIITEHVDTDEKTPKNELDEEQLVKNVEPLLEEANSLLQECNGAIRALDPDGRIAANAKARAASHEASSEEYSLAGMLKELTDTAVKTIDNGKKKKIDGMPHAKKELNPLWALLSEPLFQILAAVVLLLTGVLVGRLLEGLGLGPFGPVPPTKPLRRFPCPYCQGPHAWSRELVAEPTPPRPKFNTPRPSDSIHAVSLSSNPTASTHLNATGSASSDSLMGISISVARQNSGMISILVRRPEDSPKNAIPMIASFDTECRGGNLISLRHFNRLREYGNVPFEPVDGEVELLQGEPVRLLGIARGLTWQLELGFKTYTSDFYIVDMLRYDALVGRDTIFKYELLQRGADYAHHLERQEARRRKRIE